MSPDLTGFYQFSNLNHTTLIKRNHTYIDANPKLGRGNSYMFKLSLIP